jgi:diguanylate cyclase
MVQNEITTPLLNVIQNARKELAPEQRLALRLRLAERLHTTLDPVEVLERFALELQQELGKVALHFIDDSGDLRYAFGSERPHSCSYQLHCEKHPLGELQLQRRRRFGEHELELAELMIGCLVPALHNALVHRNAIRNATRDALTGVGNRTALELAAAHEIALARRHGAPASLLIIDIDHFKAINDTLGHLAGDHAIRETAQLLRQISRDTDNLFRFGGEEFVLLLSGTDCKGAAVIAERVRQQVEKRWRQSLQITVSIGVAELGNDESLLAWLERADAALYEGKRAGRNCVRVAQQAQTQSA